MSLGRYPNGTGPLVAMGDLSLGSPVRAEQDSLALLASFRIVGMGAPNTGPLVGPIVISEIMYAPAEGLAEYVVLKNISDVPVPFFDPANPEQRVGTRQRGRSSHSRPSFVLPAGESLLRGRRRAVASCEEQYELNDGNAGAGAVRWQAEQRRRKRAVA